MQGSETRLILRIYIRTVSDKQFSDFFVAILSRVD